MKKIIAAFAILLLSGCAELQQVASQYPQTSGVLSNADIASGLKEALNNGISKEVSKLTATDGFFKNQAVKILLPPELQKVETALRKVGLGSLVDDGIRS